MIEDYRYFYLSMCGGITFLAGMFYSLEFGFFTPNFFASGIFTLFPMVLFYLYVDEVRKSPTITQSKNKNPSEEIKLISHHR